MSRFAGMRFPARVALALVVALAPGCGRHAETSPPVTVEWVVGRSQPDFDPDGPPQPVRAALERLLTRSLVAEDSAGAVVPDAAERFSVSADRLTWTFQLRWDLRFADGTGCTSRDFRSAILAGLGRSDHATRAWLLQAMRGIDAVRAGRALPELGIDAPDARTLVIRLSRPDPLLPRKLAQPGVSAAWRARGATNDWRGAVGLGPFRVAGVSVGRLRLARTSRGDAGSPDTVSVRFVPNSARVRSLLREARADLVWPIPPGLAETPPGYRASSEPARPGRWMWLVMRADVPPTSKLPARHAIAHAIQRAELLLAMGVEPRPAEPWLNGAPPFDFPKLDAGEVAAWLERGKFGRSFHVTLAYDAEGPAAGAARALQGAAARLNLYYELQPLTGSRFLQSALTGQSQLLLVEAQAPLDRAESQLAQLVMPLRGPAVGGFRTGWRTREFDPWITPRGSVSPLDAVHASDRVQEELIALPVASLPWVWLVRADGPPVGFHPHRGPELSLGRARPPGAFRH